MSVRSMVITLASDHYDIGPKGMSFDFIAEDAPDSGMLRYALSYWFFEDYDVKFRDVQGPLRANGMFFSTLYGAQEAQRGDVLSI